MAENEEALKSLLMRVKEESENVGLRLNIQKTKIKAFSHITSWQIEGEKVDAVADIIFFGSKVTEQSYCSHEIQRCLLLGRKDMINLDSILKSRDITLLTKVCIVKTMVFPVVMYRCESWTIKEAEHQELMLSNCAWRGLLKPPWIAKISNQIILKVIYSDYSLEGLWLKLKFQYFGHFMRRADSLGKVEAKGEGNSKGWGG